MRPALLLFFLLCLAARGQVVSAHSAPTNLAAGLTGETPVPLPDPAHAAAVAVPGCVYFTNVVYGGTCAFSWLNTGAPVTIYFGPDTSTPLESVTVSAGTNLTVTTDIPEPFMAWSTLPGNVLVAIPPPPKTNAVLSWSSSYTNALVSVSTNLQIWEALGWSTNGQMIYPLSNSSTAFFQVTTGDGSQVPRAIALQ